MKKYILLFLLLNLKLSFAYVVLPNRYIEKKQSLKEINKNKTNNNNINKNNKITRVPLYRIKK